VPAIFLLGRQFLSPGSALIAAFLMATSLLHVTLSQQARPHAPAMALILLAVYATVRLRRRGDLSGFVGAGLACAAALACLQSGVAVALPLVAAYLLRRRPAGRSTAWMIVVPAALLALSAYAFWPFLADSSAGKDAAQLDLHGTRLVQAGHVIEFKWIGLHGLERVLHTFWSYDPLALVMAVVGFAAWVYSGRPAGAGGQADSRRDLWVVLAFAVPYLLVLGVYRRTHGRLVLPLLPYLYLLAAYGIERAWTWGRSGVGARRALGCALALLSLALPAAAIANLAALRTRPGTPGEVARWIEHNLDPETDVVALPRMLGLPLLSDPELILADRSLLREGIPSWRRYQRRHPEVAATGTCWRLPHVPLRRKRDFRALDRDPEGFVRDMGAQYLLLEDYLARPRDDSLEEIYSIMPRMAELVFRASPYYTDVAPSLPMTYQDSPVWRFPYHALRVLQARTNGPFLEVYRLR